MISEIRVGQGVDVHRLAEGRDLWIGGIQVPHSKGSLGHSDADVLIHAICDALLGAAGLRDIGFHFPDTSGEFRDIDSKILLARVAALIKRDNWRISNIDSTLLLEKPKIAPHISAMQDAIASVLQLDPNLIAIKATTNETMGYVGRQEGLLAFAVALLIR